MDLEDICKKYLKGDYCIISNNNISKPDTIYAFSDLKSS